MDPTAKTANPTSDVAWTLTGVCGREQSVRKVTVGGAQFVVGRLDDADLQLDFRGISKRHAQFRLEDGALIAEDLGSTNGTFVNGQRITKPTSLTSGDVVQFANTPFQVTCESRRETEHTQAETVVDRAMAMLQFDRLMSQRAVTPHFQPIISLVDQQIVAFEVLGRSRIVGLESAQALFDAAALLQQEVELSQLMREEGIRSGLQLSDVLELFLNTHPSEVGDPRLLDSLSSLRQRFPTVPITLEIHESAVAHPESMRDLRNEVNALDIKLAYDDFGAGQARLLELAEVPPDYLKFDRCLVAGIDSASSQRIQMLSSLVKMVRELGIVSLAEGVETETEANTCREIGFELGQGYFWGHPESISKLLPRE